jgi:hypothetical protein
MTTAVDKWPACARLVAGRYGGPLTHSSYTTSRGTTLDSPHAVFSLTTRDAEKCVLSA